MRSYITDRQNVDGTPNHLKSTTGIATDKARHTRRAQDPSWPTYAPYPSEDVDMVKWTPIPYLPDETAPETYRFPGDDMPPHERPNPRQQWNRHGPQWEARLDGEVRRDELGDMEDAGKLLSALICVMIVELDHSYPFNPPWLMHLDDPHMTRPEYEQVMRSKFTIKPEHNHDTPEEALTLIEMIHRRPVDLATRICKARGGKNREKENRDLLPDVEIPGLRGQWYHHTRLYSDWGGIEHNHACRIQHSPFDPAIEIPIYRVDTGNAHEAMMQQIMDPDAEDPHAASQPDGLPANPLYVPIPRDRPQGHNTAHLEDAALNERGITRLDPTKKTTLFDLLTHDRIYNSCQRFLDHMQESRELFEKIIDVKDLTRRIALMASKRDPQPLEVRKSYERTAMAIGVYHEWMWGDRHVALKRYGELFKAYGALGATVGRKRLSTEVQSVLERDFRTITPRLGLAMAWRNYNSSVITTMPIVRRVKSLIPTPLEGCILESDFDCLKGLSPDDINQLAEWALTTAYRGYQDRGYRVPGRGIHGLGIPCML